MAAQGDNCESYSVHTNGKECTCAPFLMRQVDYLTVT